MTRDEAYKMFYRDYGFIEPEDMIAVGNIYNYFESMTCENCKWFDKWEQCSNEDSPCNHVNFSMDKDFGCNRWESK